MRVRLLSFDFSLVFYGLLIYILGVDRETTPFVLTAEMVRVIGGEKGVESSEFQEFVNICVDAYNFLRREANLLLTLFSMMLSTGIDQLTSPGLILFP